MQEIKLSYCQAHAWWWRCIIFNQKSTLYKLNTKQKILHIETVYDLYQNMNCDAYHVIAKNLHCKKNRSLDLMIFRITKIVSHHKQTKIFVIKTKVCTWWSLQEHKLWCSKCKLKLHYKKQKHAQNEFYKNRNHDGLYATCNLQYEKKNHEARISTCDL